MARRPPPEYGSQQAARIGIFVGDRSDDATRLRDNLLDRAHETGQALDIALNPARWPSGELDPFATAMVVVGYQESIAEAVSRAAAKCRALQVPVIVAHDPCRRYEDQSPDHLRAVNGHPWPVGSGPQGIARTLARMVGLDVSHRRIFLSYRRGHGERIALQLRHLLIDAGWRVFLDSFNIPPGAQFQQELFRDLDARSLVLVIESRSTRDSAWVDDEIAFATAHGIGIRALVLPDVGTPIRFPEETCISLKPAQLVDANATDPVLREEALDEVLTALQNANTAGFRLRTEDMMTNASGFMTDELMTVSRLADNLLVGATPSSSHVVLAIGRRPQPSDIRIVAEEAARAGAERTAVQGWLVHRLTDPDPEYIDLISWIAAMHNVEVVSLMSLPAALAGVIERTA